MRKLAAVSVAVIFASLVIVTNAQERQQTQTQGQKEPPPQGPTFKTGVELVTVDVAVSDDRGRPVSDLLPPDFNVRIDGKPRRVVSAEHVRIDVEAAKKEAAEGTETFYTSNLGPPNGRMIIFAVDQTNIRPGAARPLLATAGKFLDKLSPADRVAFVAYPPPGPAVDFTTKFDKIREAMGRVAGSQSRYKGKFNIGLFEARAIAESHDETTRRAVVQRECGLLAGGDLERCEREVELEAADLVMHTRQDTTMSLRGLRDLLTDLAVIEGQKSLILLSEGLILEGLGGELEDIARLAAIGRVTINVLLMDVPRFEVTQSQLPPTATEDRDMQVQGLENLAGMARGALFRVIGSGEAIFDRLASEMSAYYLLGVEQGPADRDGKRHRIDVEVRRKGVTVRSRRAFVLSSAVNARKSPQDRLLDALKTPFAVAELPLRVTSFAYQDPNASKVRVVLAAEVGQPGASPAEFTMGFVLIDEEGRVAASGSDKRKLSPVDGRENAPLGYLTGVLVEPGTYSLRLGAVDAEGRRGSVVRDVHAWKMAGEEFAVGDLMVGNLSDTEPMRPQVEPRVHDGRVGGYVELYAASPTAFDGTSVSFEIADSEDGPALTAVPAALAPGAQPTTRIAQAGAMARMLPSGRYIARAKIARHGKPVGVLIRPFVLVTAPSATTDEGGVVVVPSSMLSFPKFDRSAALEPAMISSMLDLVQQSSPTLKEALAEARAGRYGPAALEALTAGDQPAAAFLRGLDFFSKGDLDKAATQFNTAAGPRREYFPAAFYLGACFAAAGRDRDAAGVWQMAIGSDPRPPIVYTMFADARLRDGQAKSVVDVLKPVFDRDPSHDGIARRLGLAYVMTGHYAPAIPVLDAYLRRNPTDADALFAAVMAQYEASAKAKVPLSGEERAKLTKYVRAYKGPQQALLAKYLESLR